MALSVAWFLTDRIGELWLLAARAWPLLLAALGGRILWNTLTGLRARRMNGAADGMAS
jgi:hypothetical protein